MTPPIETIVLDGDSLPLEALAKVADGVASLRLGATGRARMDASRAVVERAAAGSAAVYGVNTGFGSLARVRIDRDLLGKNRYGDFP